MKKKYLTTVLFLLLCSQQLFAEPPVTEPLVAVPKGVEPIVATPTNTEAPTIIKSESPPKAIINFKGYLKERGTRKPLADITVYIKDSDFEASSGTDGYFEFQNLPVSRIIVIIPSMDYEKFITPEKIRKGEVVEVVYYLEAKTYGALEVVVRGKKVKKEVSRQVIKIEEAKVIPGSQGDAVKVVTNMPGVARGGTNAAGIVIRGSNAEDSRVLLDGHQIPQLFHFGNYKSVYNSDFLTQIDLYTGGFGVEFGDATGGIVNLTSKAPRTDQWGGYVDTSFVDATALAEGPITDKMSLGLAIRRSTIDLLLPLVISDSEDFAFTTLPVYYDYQFKYHFQIDSKNSFSLDCYGGLDKLEIVTALVDDAEPEFTGNFGFDTMFHSVIFHHKYKSDNFESDFSPGVKYQQLSVNLGKKFYFKLDAIGIDIFEKMRIKADKRNTLGIGIQLEPRYGLIRSNIMQPPKEGDVDVSLSNSETITADVGNWEFLGGVYLFDELEIGKVLFIPGVRLDYYSQQQKYTFSPRATIRYQIVEPVVLKLSTGLFYRTPDPDESYAPYGNTGLDFERAIHLIGGVEWAINDVWHIDLQGYYKHLDNLVNAVDESDTSGKIYDNSGKGYVYGAEILIRHSFTNNFFGWLSYSFGVAMRNDGTGTAYRPFDVDQTHNLVAVASYKFLKTWRIGFRFQFTTGEPYTEINGSVFNADNGTYIPIFDNDNKNSGRNNPHHQLDFRLDKEWIFDTWMLMTYIDIQNVYYNANPVATVYNYDYSEKASMTGLPIIPSFGIRAEF